jgi:hypothetical protein
MLLFAENMIQNSRTGARYIGIVPNLSVIPTVSDEGCHRGRMNFVSWSSLTKIRRQHDDRHHPNRPLVCYFVKFFSVIILTDRGLKEPELCHIIEFLKKIHISGD